MVIPLKILIYIPLCRYLIVELATADEVKQLHHNECIEYDREVAGVYPISGPHIHIVVAGANVVQSTTAHVSTHPPLQVLG